jgi:hypothetical protein
VRELGEGIWAFNILVLELAGLQLGGIHMKERDGFVVYTEEKRGKFVN